MFSNPPKCFHCIMKRRKSKFWFDVEPVFLSFTILEKLKKALSAGIHWGRFKSFRLKVRLESAKKRFYLETFCLFFFREIFLEKHWKSVISKNVCDYFFEAQKKVGKAYKFASLVGKCRSINQVLFIFYCFYLADKIFCKFEKERKKIRKNRKLFNSHFLKRKFPWYNFHYQFLLVLILLK